jgi:hypothetical protein
VLIFMMVVYKSLVYLVHESSEQGLILSFHDSVLYLLTLRPIVVYFMTIYYTKLNLSNDGMMRIVGDTFLLPNWVIP